MPDPVTTAVTAGVSAVLNDAAKETGKEFVKNSASVVKVVLDRIKVEFGIGFREFIETGYNKCKQIKTLLNPHEPMDIMDLYVNVKLNCGNNTLEDVEIVDEINNIKKIIITSLAGTGKSMFMRYLTVRSLENILGKIPLFIELRKINTVTEKNLLTYTYVSCKSASNKITEDQFRIALADGKFSLILDGFDETDHSIRDDLERQILQISEQYPKANIIISSRPDSRFGSWRTFYIYNVEAFTKTQIIKLIEKVNYDRNVKARFITSIKNSLSESHNSFLSTPLLAIIMLLTYEAYAEVPKKMHVFYDQAFDALLKKHDAHKEQFSRKTRSNLAVDDFKKCFSAFCAFSYLDQVIEFSDTTLKEKAVQALSYCRVKSSIKPEDFILDLQECVCMLQKDGTNTIFVHRSFQEYFTAVFSANFYGSSEKLFLLFDRLSQRSEDQVILMLGDMATEKLETEWALPVVKSILSSISLKEESTHIYNRMNGVFGPIWLNKFGNQIGATIPGDPDLHKNYFRLRSLSKLFPALNMDKLTRAFFSKKKLDKVPDIIIRAKLENHPRFISLFREPGEQISNKSMHADYVPNYNWEYDSMAIEDEVWLSALGGEDYLKTLESTLVKIESDISKRHKRQTSIIKDLF